MYYSFIDCSFAFSTDKEWRLSFSIRPCARGATWNGGMCFRSFYSRVSATKYCVSGDTRCRRNGVRNQRSGERQTKVEQTMRKTITDKRGWIKSKEFIVWKGWSTPRLPIPVNFHSRKFQRSLQHIFIIEKNPEIHSAAFLTNMFCRAKVNFLRYKITRG